MKRKNKKRKIARVIKIIFYILTFPLYIVLSIERMKKKIKDIDKKLNTIPNSNLQKTLPEDSLECDSLKDELEILKIVDKIKR